MEFRTAIKPLNNTCLISHDRGVMMFGSCFSDNIGAKLSNAMFNVDINPFGTTFNPLSISKCIEIILSQKLVEEDALFLHNGVWNNFNFHSKYSGVEKSAVLSNMNERIARAYKNITTAQTLIITFGTAYIYQLSKQGSIVNNCHKLPADTFSRTRLSVDEIAENYKKIISKILDINPAIKIVFTVSPIRHLADGIADNNLSKSILRVAIDKITSKFHAVCSYFPAYEIMLDDLRDYRFYAADMMHPSDVAIDYIWEMFQQSFFTNSLIELASKCTKLSKRFTHRHMTDNIQLIEKFNNDTLRVMNELITQYPYLDSVVGNKISHLNASVSL